MTTVRLDPVTDARWAQLLDRSPATLPFHTPGWLALLGRQYRYDVQALCIASARGTLVAGIPLARVESRLTGRRLVAIPFSDVCPPLVAADAPDPGAARAALGAALAAERARTGLDIHVHEALPEAPGAHLAPAFVVHRLDLSGGPDAVAQRYAKAQVRRGIAKARKEGVTVRRAVDTAALDAFFELHVATRRRQGVPTQPKRFIRAFTRLFEHGGGYVALAEHANRVIAAAVFLAAGRTLVYKYGASDREQLGLRPNNLIFADAIAWGCEHGLATLDFGRTDLANEGLRAFKRSWGAEEVELAYTHLGDRAPSPQPGTRERLMARVIERSPPAVGRWVGAALYRHVG